MKAKLVLLLFAGVIVAALLAFRLTLGRRAAQDAIAATETGTGDLKQKIARAKIRLRDLERASADLEKQDAETEPLAPAAPPVRKLSPHTIIANDPAKLAAYTRDFRASLDLEYGGLQKFAGLSAELYEKAKDLKTAHEQRRMDILAVAETQGVDLKSPAYQALQEKEADDFAKSEAELLGPSIVKYREFEQTQPVRETARRLGSSETYPEPPLTSAEIERVVDVLARHSRRDPENGTVYKRSTNMKEAMPELKTFLSPELADTFRWALPGGLMASIIERANRVIAR